MKAYRVLTPSGVIADGLWRTKEEIPKRIPDRWEFYFSPDDTEIIEVEVEESEFDER
jgi:hypothetical protein